MKLNTLILAFSVVFAMLAQAQARFQGAAGVVRPDLAIETDLKEGVLELAADHKVYFRYQKPQIDQPTLVLLNGLIYAIKYWDPFFELMSSKGFGVLQIAYSTQPESLEFLDQPPFYEKIQLTIQGPRQVGIETEDLVQEVMAVIDFLGVDQFHLMSLSYGSIVGSMLAEKYRDRVLTNIFAAPAVVSSNRYNSWGQGRHAWYETIRGFGDYYYDLEIQQAMLALLSPKGSPSSKVDFNTFFSGVFQMARSAKWFDLKEFASKALPPTHLFVASREEGDLLRDQLRFWELMKSNPSRGSFTLFEGGEHALPGVVPEAVAEATEQILRGQRVQGDFIKQVTSNPQGQGDLLLIE